jgi:4-hydroxybenzoate polyprenyltransferase
VTDFQAITVEITTSSALSSLVINPAKLARSRLKKASVFTFSTFAGIMIATRGNFSIQVLALAPLSTFLISLSVYLLNDVFDLGADSINAPNRPLVTQTVTRNQALGMVFLLSGLGAAIGFILGPMAFLITFLEILLGILYSVKPFNFKDRYIVKTLSIGAGGVLANLFGGIASGVVNLDLLFCSALFVVFIFSTSPLNDLGDYVGDKSQNRKTIPIVIGAKKTIKLSILTSVAPPVSALILFEILSFNPLSIVLLSVTALWALRLLLPLERTEVDLETVRANQKKMVYLHFLLQAALVIGSLPL